MHALCYAIDAKRRITAEERRWMKRIAKMCKIVQVLQRCPCSKFVSTFSYEWVANQWEVLRSFGATNMKVDRWWERRCTWIIEWIQCLLEWREWRQFLDSSLYLDLYEVSRRAESFHDQSSHFQCLITILIAIKLRGVFPGWTPISFLVESVERTSCILE